jgi:hypothetical protein
MFNDLVKEFNSKADIAESLSKEDLINLLNKQTALINLMNFDIQEMYSAYNKKYIISKSSRDYHGNEGYTGPACLKAGVVPGKIYDSIDEANIDKEKLNNVNPVGFLIEEYYV